MALDTLFPSFYCGLLDLLIHVQVGEHEIYTPPIVQSDWSESTYNHVNIHHFWFLMFSGLAQKIIMQLYNVYTTFGSSCIRGLP